MFVCSQLNNVIVELFFSLNYGVWAQALASLISGVQVPSKYSHWPQVASEFELESFIVWLRHYQPWLITKVIIDEGSLSVIVVYFITYINFDDIYTWVTSQFVIQLHSLVDFSVCSLYFISICAYFHWRVIFF